MGQQANKPKFETGERVSRQGKQEGRVQAISFDVDAKSWRYIVKWDLGPTTNHLEDELEHASLPTHYQ